MKDEVQKIKLQLYKGPLTEERGPLWAQLRFLRFQVASRVFLQPWLGLQDQLHHVRSSKGCLAMQDYFPKRQCQTVWCGVHQLHVKLPKRLEKKTSFGSRKGVGLHDCSLVVNIGCYTVSALLDSKFKP